MKNDDVADDVVDETRAGVVSDARLEAIACDVREARDVDIEVMAKSLLVLRRSIDTHARFVKALVVHWRKYRGSSSAPMEVTDIMSSIESRVARLLDSYYQTLGIEGYYLDAQEEGGESEGNDER